MNTDEKNELLNIFVSEEDKKGTDILKISNYFDLFVLKTEGKIQNDSHWEVEVDFTGLMGRIAMAIKGGFDVADMKMFVADTSHFSKKIVEGLKTGLYHIGESKAVAGNMRPAVLDENERLVKFITLRKAYNPSNVLGDLSNISMQASLKDISTQLETISRDIQGLTEFVRRDTLNKPFLNARDRVIQAVTATEEDRKQYLHEADVYLMDGLNALYEDINAELNNLINHKGPFRSLKDADTYMAHINEDMQMIPRYVGLRIYLFNYLGKITDANRILEEYSYHLENMVERKIGNGKYTAVETLHRYYPYQEEDRDFWLKVPGQILTSLRSFTGMIDQKPEELYFIQAEK